MTAFSKMRSCLQKDFKPRLLCFHLLGGCIENCLAKQTSARESLGFLFTAFWLYVFDKHFCRLFFSWHSCVTDFQSGGGCEWAGCFSEQLSFYPLCQRPPVKILLYGGRLGLKLARGSLVWKFHVFSPRPRILLSSERFRVIPQRKIQFLKVWN